MKIKHFKNHIYFKRKFLITILGLSISFNSFSQNDFESWNSLGLDMDITKKASVELSNELRLDNNATGLKKYLIDLGFKYELTKFLDASLIYRYSRIDDLEAYINEHLIYAKIGVSYKLDRFDLSLQTRYDRAYEVYGYSTLVKTQDAWRNKAAVSYNIYGLPLEPYISYEIFVTELKTGFETNKYRLFGGIKYKLNRNNTFAAFYGFQQSLLKPEKSFILGLKYNVKIDFNN